MKLLTCADIGTLAWIILRVAADVFEVGQKIDPGYSLAYLWKNYGESDPLKCFLIESEAILSSALVIAIVPSCISVTNCSKN